MEKKYMLCSADHYKQRIDNLIWFNYVMLKLLATICEFFFSGKLSSIYLLLFDRIWKKSIYGWFRKIVRLRGKHRENEQSSHSIL